MKKEAGCRGGFYRYGGSHSGLFPGRPTRGSERPCSPIRLSSRRDVGPAISKNKKSPDDCSPGTRIPDLRAGYLLASSAALGLINGFETFPLDAILSCEQQPLLASAAAFMGQTFSQQPAFAESLQEGLLSAACVATANATRASERMSFFIFVKYVLYAL